MTDRSPVIIRVQDDDVVVEHPELVKDRSARMLFGSILGGRSNDSGWIVPRRRASISTLVVRINTFLEAKGWLVNREGIADAEVQRDIERKRSFERTRDAAASLRAGEVNPALAGAKRVLAEFGWDDAARGLLPHQETGLIHGLTAINAANFSVPGAGKTATTLAVAATHFAHKIIDLVLVVGPLSSFAPWEKEAKAALPGRVRVRRIRGAAGQRRAAYGGTKRGDLVLVSYATAAADRLELIELCRTFRVMLVADESHRVKRFRGGMWAPALMEISKYALIRFVLSGTPMPQNGRDLFSQLNILWPGGELTGPRDSFAARVDRNFASVLRDVQPFVSRTPKEALGLPPYEIIRHDVPITRTQAEVYDLIESRFRKAIQNVTAWRDKLDALRRARPIRLLQAATNPDLLNRVDSYFSVPRVESPNPTLMERLATYRGRETPAKCEAGLGLVAEIAARNEKVVCWSNFVPNLDYFSELVRSKLGVPCFQIDGRVAAAEDSPDQMASNQLRFEQEDTRERIIEQFLDSPGAAVLVTNPASCSESISLHRSCHTAVYLDRTYDCSLFLQSIDRIHRLGLPKGTKVTVHILLATVGGRSTIDQLADASLRRKEDAMKRLLEGAELRPFNLPSSPLDAAQGDEEDLGELLRYLLGQEK